MSDDYAAREFTRRLFAVTDDHATPRKSVLRDDNDEPEARAFARRLFARDDQQTPPPPNAA